MLIHETMTPEKLGRDNKNLVQSIFHDEMFCLFLPQDSFCFSFLGR